jgi:tetratricopeptide (TPR) repeat protein/DNA-binding XRE family transcriptional regulator
MSSHTYKQYSLSPLSLVLKDYRDTYVLTQEQLASDLHIDVRTLRRWESGETVINDVRELRRVAALLGIEPERLGVTTPGHISLSPEQISTSLTHIWNLVDVARNREADALIDPLIQDLRQQITTEDDPLLRPFAHALHLAGYAKSVVTRARESHNALVYYREMEKIARILHDDTLLNIALTYEGDMYSRTSDLPKAITYLEAARDTTPHADIAARGNAMQLLGRAYLRANRFGAFERAMGEAEALAYLVEPGQSSTHGQYSLGTVYEEYGRSYTQLGQAQQAIDYLDKAEASLASTRHWDILLKTARAMALVHGGEIKAGISLAIESIELCRDHHTLRLIERIYAIQKYLDHLNREIGQAGATLREALDGPIEY